MDGRAAASWRIPNNRTFFQNESEASLQSSAKYVVIRIIPHPFLKFQNKVPPATPVPSLAPAISRLSGQLELLTTSHAKNSATLSSLAHERLEVDEREKELREMVEKAEEKRAWFSSFREWIEGVAGFLDEKVKCIFSYASHMSDIYF